jgi:predicted permease
MNALMLLAPVFLTIMLGAALRQSGLIKSEHWISLDHVAYYVLFPAIVMKSIAVADFSQVPVVRMALAMNLAILTMYALALLARNPLESMIGLQPVSFTSFFQGITRWHTFVALAIMPLAFGNQGVALAALAAAAMIPLLNVGAVWVLATYASGKKPDTRSILAALARNPFVLSSLAGIALNLSGLGLTPVLEQTFELIGRGALAAALLSTGAGLRLRQLPKSGPAVAIATIVKLALMPVLMWLWTWSLGVTGLPQAVAIVSGGMPSAAASYILARKMKGDSTLMALILTAQVLASAVTLPALITIVGGIP